jgi:hypothetical protein
MASEVIEGIVGGGGGSGCGPAVTEVDESVELTEVLPKPEPEEEARLPADRSLRGWGIRRGEGGGQEDLVLRGSLGLVRVSVTQEYRCD